MPRGEANDLNRTYDTLASRFDEWSALVLPDVRTEWVNKVDQYLSRGDRVVELGCGTGTPVGRLLATRYEYVGVDTSLGMLAHARVAMPNVSLIRADMHTCRFAPGSLGAVVACYSISHTRREHHAHLLAAIASWLRVGGVFVGNLHSRDDPDGFDADWLGAGPMEWSGYDAGTNRHLLRAAGLDVVESAVVEQIEPEGTRIGPLWFVARRPPTGGDPR